jgi:hypothetical protein
MSSFTAKDIEKIYIFPHIKIKKEDYHKHVISVYDIEKKWNPVDGGTEQEMLREGSIWPIFDFDAKLPEHVYATQKEQEKNRAKFIIDCYNAVSDLVDEKVLAPCNAQIEVYESGGYKPSEKGWVNSVRIIVRNSVRFPYYCSQLCAICSIIKDGRISRVNRKGQKNYRSSYQRLCRFRTIHPRSQSSASLSS